MADLEYCDRLNDEVKWWEINDEWLDWMLNPVMLTDQEFGLQQIKPVLNL